MNGITLTRVVTFGCALLVSLPAFAQVDLNGTYILQMHEDYLERGPGSDMGDFTGLPLNDEGRAKALLFTSDQLSMIERQCLHWSPFVTLYRPQDLRIWSDTDASGRVISWNIAGAHLQDVLTIWMDGRQPPSENAWYPSGGFTTGKWEGDTLTTRTTHLKTNALRRGNGIPASDKTTITAHFTRHDDLLTIVAIQEDPVYLTEPHVVSRLWTFDGRGSQSGRRAICDPGTEVPRLEDSGIVPHYLPGKNPEADHMTRTYNIPKEAALGYAESLYPEYRKKIRNVYVPPASCGRYCCGWIETQGVPGGAPNVTCNDGGFAELGPRGRRAVEGENNNRK
jgi:hypothetical protein